MALEVATKIVICSVQVSCVYLYRQIGSGQLCLSLQTDRFRSAVFILTDRSVQVSCFYLYRQIGSGQLCLSLQTDRFRSAVFIFTDRSVQVSCFYVQRQTNKPNMYQVNFTSKYLFDIVTS